MKTYIRLFNRYGDLQKVLDNKAIVSWEYNRKGGCGQGSCQIPTPDDSLEHAIRPGAFLRVYMDEEVRYTGRLIRSSRMIGKGVQDLNLTFYGFLIDLSTLIVSATYVGQGVKDILIDILDNYVLPYSDVSYNASDIDDPGYSVEDLVLNHTVKDAVTLLANLSGSVEWGVDSSRNFFFKLTDRNIKNVFLIGKDITQFTEERKDDEIINSLNVFGAEGATVTIESSLSIATHGKRQANLFETSISSGTDLFRLGYNYLKNTASSRRSIKFSLNEPDIFIERTRALGACAVSVLPIRLLPKYHQFKYGTSKKYGNLKRDQFSNIRYTIQGGGINADITLLDDVPNVGDLQKRVEFEIKDLQRR